jgi:SNF2 family DNA or RNA helicase
MDMGLGKTLVALTEFMDHAHGDKLATRLVVVCPNSFKKGWAGEIVKHGFKACVHVFESNKMKAAAAFVDSERFEAPPILIVNYEAVRGNKVIDLIESFTYGRGAMLAIDESIAIKNNRSQQSKAVRGICPMFRYVRCLTGKPLTQGPHDLWAQLVAIGAQNRNFYAFRAMYCRMGGWQGKAVIGALNEDRLTAEMKPFVFQAKKKDWLPGLPDKAYTERSFELGPLKNHYDEMHSQFVTWLKNNKRVAVEIAITKYLKLQQIMCGFIHDEGGEPESLVEDAHNPRLKLLLDTLTETDGKVAVVYKHRYVGAQLEEALFEYHPVAITGGMKPAEIEEAKSAFNDDPAVRIILLQQQASKFGHTLLGDQRNGADRCSTMIFYENSFSLDDRSQVEDRIHRMGQLNACLYVDFVGTDMDRLIISALQHKENVYQAIMTMAEAPR